MGENAIKRQTHVADALVAGFAVLPHGGGYNGVKARVEALHEQAGQFEDALGKATGEHLVEHHARCVYIRAMVHADAKGERLWGHKMQRAHDVTGDGEAGLVTLK